MLGDRVVDAAIDTTIAAKQGAESTFNHFSSDGKHLSRWGALAAGAAMLTFGVMSVGALPAVLIATGIAGVAGGMLGGMVGGLFGAATGGVRDVVAHHQEEKAAKQQEAEQAAALLTAAQPEAERTPQVAPALQPVPPYPAYPMAYPPASQPPAPMPSQAEIAEIGYLSPPPKPISPAPRPVQGQGPRR